MVKCHVCICDFVLSMEGPCFVVVVVVVGGGGGQSVATSGNSTFLFDSKLE